MQFINTNSRRIKWLLIFTVSVFLTTPLVGVADIAMIVHKDSSLSDVRIKDVKLLYLGKRKKIGGIRTIPVSLPNLSQAAKQFSTLVLSKTPKQLKAYWTGLVFTGKGAPPPVLDSPQAIKQWIVENPEGMAFIDSNDVDDSVSVAATYK